MAEKKTTKTAVKKTATAAKKAPATKKATAAKKEVLYLNEENAGFKAGDVYQALAAAGKALSLAEIAKAAKITAEDAILGIGWLLKEGKIKNEDNKLVLA
uniref:winged helix-turn-helix domain-containing protein n=1 Tax=Prevotella sp. TaxID=59823 RepID=UPI004029F685